MIMFGWYPLATVIYNNQWGLRLTILRTKKKKKNWDKGLRLWTKIYEYIH